MGRGVVRLPLAGLLVLGAGLFLAGCAKEEAAETAPAATAASASGPGNKAAKEDLHMNPNAGAIAAPGSKSGG